MRTVVLMLSICLVVSPAISEPRTGEEVYTKTCSTCHSIGVVNAPKTHDKAAWQARNKDLATLVESTKKGINAMPPFGTCMDCTDKELEAAIKFMMEDKKG